MPLQLLSQPTMDAVHSRSLSPLMTPASKSQIPTICLTTATPCDADSSHNIGQVAPWMASDASRVSIAPKSTTSGETSRKRLIPKKSKLSLLGSSAKAREQDFSDVVRRVGGAPVDSATEGFEIYVDPANDPDIGEILMVKKKKSRLALDGIQWGTLGEVTNVPPVAKPKEKVRRKDSLLKMKVDENQKWWSIGRGRKDSKEKDKDKTKVKDRAKSPEPTEKPADARTRFNSLDSGILLKNPVHIEHPEPPVEGLRVPTPPSAMPAPPSAAASGGGRNSVAIRAMRSVRSLARIGSWAQLRNMPNPDMVVTSTAPVKDKESDKKKKKKKVKDKKEKDKAKETIRYSGSSFEAGTLSASPAGSQHESKSLGKKKASILGLGLPSTVRLPSSRSGSAASSVVATNTFNHRLSADSACLLGGGIIARERSGSAMSTISSPRPMSVKSRVSRESSGSSGAVSVKWDEAGLKTMKEIRRKDKEMRRKEKEESKEKKKKSKRSKGEKDGTRESSSDNRKRTPLSAIFPGVVSEREGNETEQPPPSPILIIGRATVDGYEHGQYESDAGNLSMETPRKPVRPRPASDQPLAISRPIPICEGDDDNAIISLLDAATNDLAQLINRLDLEATPGSVEKTPMGHSSPFLPEPSENLPRSNRSVAESPVKGLRCTNSSMTSLKPYIRSCSKSTGVQLGRNIAPWSTLNASISPSKPSPNTSTFRVNFQDNAATVRTHKRTLTPAPAVDPPPVFKALRPATSRLPLAKTVVGSWTGISPFIGNVADRSPSSMTFGSGHSKSESRGSLSVSPVFKKAQGLAHKKTSLATHATLDSGNLPILPDVRRSLGLTGTMGYSVGSIAEQGLNGSNPDSDIPEELQVILSNSDQEDTVSFKREWVSSPGLPPEIPLPAIDNSSLRSSLAEIPVFRGTVTGEDDSHADAEETGASSEDDTKRSFDFTGELRKLNESGASDRRSFIEQLENAFRTPANVNLRCDFEELPPLPKLNMLQDELSRAGESSFNLPTGYESCELSQKDFPTDVNVYPSLLPGSDGLAVPVSDEEPLDDMSPEVLRSAPSVSSQSSAGQFNRDFKFGGKHSSSSNDNKDNPLLTLSDIIPPPEIARRLSMASSTCDESSLMKSILAHAIEIESPPSCPRLDSDASSKHEARDNARNSYLIAGIERNPSVLSFAGFDSFAEVRRGFEFRDSRPGFYPPPGAMSDKRQRKHESFYSIASVSSYGNVLHSGRADPFDYGSMVSLQESRKRPVSDDFSFSMSTSVDDTFSFLRQQLPRHRVDSDASSFDFRASLSHPYNRCHRRPESGVSVVPPVSIFNRNSTYRRRGDSITSTSSIAPSSANCQRFSWTRRRSRFSVESATSSFSDVHLGRPGLGDKMLDSAAERGTPLESISASPPPSLAGSVRGERVHSEYDNPTSYDSIMDTRHASHKTDSLFEKTDCRNSICSSDSTFFEQQSDNVAAKPPRYRPISSLSIPSVHSPPKEDDTMISMLGGGHVRRRSVTSMIGASPCIQVERRKNILSNPPETVLSRIKKTEDQESPEISRVLETKPSIASTANLFQFGDERMIRAKHGLLERQSLENTVLMGDGEDLSGSFRLPVFTRPTRTNRSRSSTCTSSSGVDTPPLSISDGYSSFSDGSLSSIDLSQLNVLLSNPTQPLSNAIFDRARPSARGHGHRQRISQARASRTSIYETIEEELTSPSPHKASSERSTPGPLSHTGKLVEAATKTMEMPQVYVVDPETSSVDSYSLWDDERGMMALRRYYALRDEAEDTVTESKRTWLDTPFSTFAVQSFDPPRHTSGMQAMLQHSLQTYGPLPSDLRPRRMRSRVNSRPSPYPRVIKTSFTSSPSLEHLRATVAASIAASRDNIVPRQPLSLPTALQQITINPNVPLTMSPEPKEYVVSLEKPERVFGLLPRAGPAVRRTALGLSKKSAGRNGAENKENNTTAGNISTKASMVVNVSQGTIISSSDGLRLNRPRPSRGRPPPASTRPIRA